MVKKYLTAVCLACGTVFLFLQALIFTQFKSTVPKGIKMDYIIILGAKVVGERPSKALNERIKAVAAYLKQNPEAKAVASGGLGKGDTVTEAEVIKRQLILNGISGERIILEQESRNTEQNLKFSFNKIVQDSGIQDMPHIKIAVVTNNFHMFRTKKIAEKLGYENISGISAKTPLISTPKAHIRESLSIIKFYIFK